MLCDSIKTSNDEEKHNAEASKKTRKSSWWLYEKKIEEIG